MRSSVWMAVGLISLGSVVASAQEGQKPPKMSAEEAAMMAKWHAFMTPGEGHKLLAAKVGTWTGNVSIWTAPGTPPATSVGTSTYEMILDGRYLEDRTQSTFMGMPFSGRGITAYDNMKNKYTAIWIDTMGTGIMTMEGTYDAAKKTLSWTSMAPDVMTGTYKPMKSSETYSDPDHFKMESWSQTPDGKGWWKSMEIDFTRKK